MDPVHSRPTLRRQTADAPNEHLSRRATAAPSNPVTPLVHTDHVSSDTISEASGTCDCAVERLRTEERTYSIAPQAGGGWTSWGGAFTRFVIRFATLPTHCFVITQPPNQRYVQLMLGHGHACVEASSNEYLHGDFRLGQSEERVLERLGFRSPALGPAAQDAGNWRIDQPNADPVHIAELLVATMSGVMAFDSRWPVTIEVFGADDPCEACCWAGM